MQPLGKKLKETFDSSCLSVLESSFVVCVVSLGALEFLCRVCRGLLKSSCVVCLVLESSVQSSGTL